jgi:hypothetical protein
MAKKKVQVVINENVEHKTIHILILLISEMET